MLSLYWSYATRRRRSRHTPSATVIDIFYAKHWTYLFAAENNSKLHIPRSLVKNEETRHAYLVSIQTWSVSIVERDDEGGLKNAVASI